MIHPNLTYYDSYCHAHCSIIASRILLQNLHISFLQCVPASANLQTRQYIVVGPGRDTPLVQYNTVCQILQRKHH